VNPFCVPQADTGTGIYPIMHNNNDQLMELLNGFPETIQLFFHQ
jgi:hypothetical protein